MGVQAAIPVPWPLSSFPGATPQESAGRLINAYAEPLGDPATGGSGAPNDGVVRRRCPGLTQFATTGQTGYRGGLIVNNLSYEIFSGEALTLDAAGNVNLLGPLLGTKKVSIARNQNAAPDVVVVDIDNGAFTVSGGGAPVPYNGGGNLPQPSSICFQDGYFFYTIGDGRVFASPLNSAGTINGLTFIICQARSDVTLLRGIPYSGLLFLFTTGGVEVWQDVANPAPAFPYGRLLVLPFGLIQPNAIAGFETGFEALLWVAQDFGVYYLPVGSQSPTKVSPPDLDRLIEAQVKAGAVLEAGCYMFAGKKFWTIQSPAWSWEINLATAKWNERSSLQALGVQGRWRGTGGHPAFGKWLLGDVQSGAIVSIDDTNFNDITTILTNQPNSAPQLYRLESGMVDDFPNRLRVARSDFHFVAGTGQAARNLLMNVLGAVAGNGGVVRLTVNSAVGVNNNDTGIVANVGGTVEANGAFKLTVIDATHIELQGTVFANAYTAGGTVTDVTTPPNVQNPTAALSWSDDGGESWSVPRVRPLGPQKMVKLTRITLPNTGTSGWMGRRWRIDVTDPVYTGFLRATQSSDPREN